MQHSISPGVQDRSTPFSPEAQVRCSSLCPGVQVRRSPLSTEAQVLYRPLSPGDQVKCDPIFPGAQVKCSPLSVLGPRSDAAPSPLRPRSDSALYLSWAQVIYNSLFLGAQINLHSTGKGQLSRSLKVAESWLNFEKSSYVKNITCNRRTNVWQFPESLSLILFFQIFFLLFQKKYYLQGGGQPGKVRFFSWEF